MLPYYSKERKGKFNDKLFKVLLSNLAFSEEFMLISSRLTRLGDLFLKPWRSYYFEHQNVLLWWLWQEFKASHRHWPGHSQHLHTGSVELRCWSYCLAAVKCWATDVFAKLVGLCRLKEPSSWAWGHCCARMCWSPRTGSWRATAPGSNWAHFSLLQPCDWLLHSGLSAFTVVWVLLCHSYLNASDLQGTRFLPTSTFH